MAFDKLNLQKLNELAQKNLSTNSSTEGAKTGETFVNSAFDSNQTQNTNSSSSTQNVHYAEMVDTNIFSSSSEAGTSLDADSLFSNYESKLNDMLNKTMKQTSRAMTWSTIAAGLSTAGDLVTNLSNNKAANNIFSSVFGGSSSVDNAQKSANSVIKDLGLTSDLSGAIQDYSKKGNDKNKANLQKQLSAAEADRSTLATKLSEQSSVISTATKNQKALEEESKKLGDEATTMQADIDKLTETIQETAKKKIGELDKDDETQNQTIENCNTDIEDATNTIKEKETWLAKNPVPVPITDPKTGTITGYNPSQAQISEAQQELQDAKDKKAAAEEEKKAAEEKIAQNAIDRSEQQTILADPKNDPEKGADLVSKITERGKVLESKSEKDAAVEEQKNIVTNATTLHNTCQQKMNELSSQMIQARQLLGA